jgi:hypothetical protein
VVPPHTHRHEAREGHQRCGQGAAAQDHRPSLLAVEGQQQQRKGAPPPSFLQERIRVHTEVPQKEAGVVQPLIGRVHTGQERGVAAQEVSQPPRAPELPSKEAQGRAGAGHQPPEAPRYAARNETSHERPLGAAAAHVEEGRRHDGAEVRHSLSESFLFLFS